MLNGRSASKANGGLTTGPPSNDRVLLGSNATPPGQPSSCAAMQSSTAIRSLADVSIFARISLMELERTSLSLKKIDWQTSFICRPGSYLCLVPRVAKNWKASALLSGADLVNRHIGFGESDIQKLAKGRMASVCRCGLPWTQKIYCLPGWPK